MTFTFEVDCKECSGEGILLVGPTCWQPASNCCGGCYDEHKCDNCNGTGKIEAEFSKEYLQEIIEFHFNGEPDNAHELVMEIISSESN